MNYKNQTIALNQNLDYNTTTGKNVTVWVWRADCGMGQHQDREGAIEAAKTFIDWRLEDPQMNNIF